MSSLFTQLPNELINVILSYNKHFKIRKGEPVTIIPRDDERFTLLSTVPRVEPCEPPDKITYFLSHREYETIPSIYSYRV